MPPTRAALVELREERELVRGGYDFLDEKRLLLAGEMLRILGLIEAENAKLRQAQARASEALAAAIARHGLDGLQVYPVPPHGILHLAATSHSFLGVRVLDTRLEQEPAHDPGIPPVYPSPEAIHCAHAFHALLRVAAAIAGLSGNLHRLMVEYRRTQRRAKALEDVIMPEIEIAVADMEARLEEMDQEEAIRVRLHDRRAEAREPEP